MRAGPFFHKPFGGASIGSGWGGGFGASATSATPSGGSLYAAGNPPSATTPKTERPWLSLFAPDLLSGGRPGSAPPPAVAVAKIGATTPGKFDLTPYLGILENGVPTPEDLRLADKLYCLIDPEVCGLLVTVTSGIPHRFESPTVGSTGTITAGSTRITFSQAVSRREGGVAEEILLTPLPGKGVWLTTPPHERTHAPDFRTLPPDYQAIPLPEIPRQGRLVEIYQAILANRYWDEAIAFSSELRFVERFREKTGRDLYTFGIHQSLKTDHDRFLPAYQEKGLQGIYEWVGKDEGYLPYKVASLYLALLIKNGATQFPKWDDLLQEVGIKEVDGQMVLTPADLRKFYQDHLEPFLKAKGFQLALWSFGLGGRNRQRLAKAALYFTSQMNPAEAADFLKNDFDFVIGQIGALIFEDPLTEESTNLAARERPETNLLPDRLTPMRSGDPQELSTRPEVVADKVEIAGRFVEFLYKLDRASEEGVLDQWEAFLLYAERSDPRSGARVYSHLLALLEGETFGKSEEQKKFQIRWSLGVSLVRSGYTALGRGQLKEGSSCFLHIEGWRRVKAVRDALKDVEDLIGLGLTDLLERFLSNLIVTSEKGSEELLCEVAKGLSKNTAPGLSPHYWQATITRLVDESWKAIRLNSYYNSGDIGDFIVGCLESPWLFRLGVRFLSELLVPLQLTIDKFYSLASKNLPPDFDDQERIVLAQAYEGAIKGISYSDDDSFEHRKYNALYNALLKVASLLLGGQDPGTKRMGLDILEKYSPTDSLAVGGQQQWELGKASALIDSVADLPQGEKEGILRRLFVVLRDMETMSHLSGRRMSLLLLLGQSTIREGLSSLAAEIASHLAQPAVREHLFHGMGTGIEFRVIGSGGGAKAQRMVVERRTNLLIPLFQGVLEGGAGLEGLLDRVRRDVDGGRQLFSVEGLLEGLSLLGTNQVFKAMSHAEGILAGFARAAIDLYVASLGGDSEPFTDEWAPLVNALKTLPVPPATKDDLFAHLIEAATPETGVMGSGSGLAEVEKIWEGLKLVEFVFEEKGMSKSEALLLDRFAQAMRRVQWNLSDPRSHGAFKGLEWVFGHIADSSILDPARKGLLSGLRQGQEYRAAFSRLFSFLEDPSPIAFSDLPQLYQSAVRSGHLGPDLRTQIQACIARELGPLRQKYTSTINILSQDKMEGTLLMRIYRDWQKAWLEGNETLADLLFELWLASDEATHIADKRTLFFECLMNPVLAPKSKRRIFEEWARTTDISPYVRRRWREIVERGDREREELLYQTIIPIRLYKRGDEEMAFVLEGSLEEARAYYSRYRRHRDAGQKDPTFIDWKMDPSNPDDWALYSSGIASGGRPIEDALRFLASASPQDIQQLPLRAKKEQSKKSPYASQSTFPEIILPVINRFHRIPDQQEAQDLLSRFDLFYRKLRKNADRIRIALFEMPEVFRNRDPLTQFLLTRFFLTLPAGRQQVLLKKVKGAKPEEALRIFFEKTGLEKVGQFLSFWPEVPEEVRQELSHLQDQVAPSDFEEVKETIRRQLGAGAETECILKNLERKPLGSGSIGECYRSRLLNGEEVVVKVIPPSKEEKFRRAMVKMKEVQQILDLYSEEELPGTRESHRLTGMFLEMVEREFDLRSEARSGIWMSEDLPEGVRIPEYVRGLASKKVLVQRLAKGVKLDEVKDPELRTRVIERLRNFLLVKQVFERGLYHSDLQPGNILVDEKTGIVSLLDFGQVGELSEQERKNLMEAGAYFVGDDVEKCVQALERMAKPGTNYSPDKLVGEIRLLRRNWNPLNDLSPVVDGIFRACHRCDLWIDLDYLQLLKGIATFEATVSTESSVPSASRNKSS